MATPTQIRKRNVWMMRKTVQLLGNILENVSQEDATTYRDGGDGWTVVEVVCHLRDFDEFFLGRAESMRDQDHPKLPGYDHEAIAIERNYNAQNLAEVYADLVAHRAQFAAFFKALTDEQWERTGVHPERDSFTMTDSVMQVSMHDIDHMEQITRILNERKNN